jgi:hypothetical protein
MVTVRKSTRQMMKTRTKRKSERDIAFLQSNNECKHLPEKNIDLAVYAGRAMYKTLFPSMAEKQSNEKVREVMIWLRYSYGFMMLVEISLSVSLLRK